MPATEYCAGPAPESLCAGYQTRKTSSRDSIEAASL